MKDFVRDDALLRALSDPAVPVAPVSHAGVPQLNLRGDASRYRQGGKRVLDIALVLLSLPVTLPIVVLAALALWVESGLPFYTQERLGRNGKRFRILKLRTMVRDADVMLERLLEEDEALRFEWARTQKLKSDPRVTRVGAVLRMTSLDELPQLWNVLTGDMTLVGPRPMMPEQLPRYGDPQAYFALRPGLTGAWQVSARNEDTFEVRSLFDARYRVSHDLWEDLVIMWRTVGVVLRRTGY